MITTRTSTEGGHDRVTVWRNGQNIGALTVGEGEGRELAEHIERRWLRVALERLANVLDVGPGLDDHELVDAAARKIEAEGW